MEKENTKKCCTCKKIKYLHEFHKNKSLRDGLSHTCKVCFNSRVKTVIYIGNKKCSECNKVKDSKEFYKSNTGKDGLRSKCKECWSKSNKKYKSENPEKNRYSPKKYRNINLVKYRIRQKKYRQANREKIREKMMEYRKRRKDEISISNKNYVKNLPDGYIKTVICRNSQLIKEDIPKELIDTYRQLLLLKRTLRR